LIKKRIEKILNDQEFKKRILTRINEKVDIPKISEEDEYIIYEKFYDAAADSIRIAIEEL